MEFNVAVAKSIGGAGTGATGGAAATTTKGGAVVVVPPPIPATFAGKLEEAKRLHATYTARFAALRAAPPAKKRTTIIDGCNLSAAALTVVEEVTETPVAELLNAWHGPIDLTPIEDLFGDDLDYAVDAWWKLELISADMLPAMEKYAALRQDRPTVLAATTAFVTNYRAIDAVLSTMEAQAAGNTSTVAAVEAIVRDVNARLAAAAAEYGAIIRPPAAAPAGLNSGAAAAGTCAALAADGLDARAGATGDDLASRRGGRQLLEDDGVGSGSGDAGEPFSFSSQKLLAPIEVPAEMAALGVTPAHLAFLKVHLLGSGIDAPAFELLHQTSIDGGTMLDLPDLMHHLLVVGCAASVVAGHEWLFGGYIAMRASVTTPPPSFVFTLTNPHGLQPTAWRRTSNVYDMSGAPCSIGWVGALLASYDSVLEWRALESTAAFESRAPHGTKVFTGMDAWRASEVLIYRV